LENYDKCNGQVQCGRGLLHKKSASRSGKKRINRDFVAEVANI